MTWTLRNYSGRYKKLIALADYFDVTMDYLVGRTDE